MECTTKKVKKHFRVDRLVYQWGKYVWLPFLIAGIWFRYYGYENYASKFVCAFRRMSGLPCPGCGGTRAFYYLFCGDLLKSFLFNPIVIYVVLAYLHFMCRYIYRKFISHTIENKEIKIDMYLYITLIVLLGQWIIRLIIIFSHIFV